MVPRPLSATRAAGALGTFLLIVAAAAVYMSPFSLVIWRAAGRWALSGVSQSGRPFTSWAPSALCHDRHSQTGSDGFHVWCVGDSAIFGNPGQAGCCVPLMNTVVIPK